MGVRVSFILVLAPLKIEYHATLEGVASNKLKRKVKQMATKLTPIAASALNPKVNYRQAVQPVYASAVFAGDDADNHDYIVAARGKRQITTGLTNKTNKTATIQLYGAPAIDSAVGDDGVVVIGSSWTVTTGLTGSDTQTEAFPFYIIRVSLAATPDGENVTVTASIVH